MSRSRTMPVAHLDVSVPRYGSLVHRLALVSAPPRVPGVKPVLFENEGPWGSAISGASPDGDPLAPYSMPASPRSIAPSPSLDDTVAQELRSRKYDPSIRPP
ncbi:hypothetical protein DL768_004504 [Monosporascus sp. mg162]|nr:hypothetical protein DL768_004504 [Monosporascus sp. mg162]